MKTDNPAKICLNMIVKNEEENIIGCLKNVAHLCDAMAIVDTGSTDRTVKIIEKFMEKNNIPGEVIQRPWFEFNGSRSEALRHGEDVIYRIEMGTIKEKPKAPKRWKPRFTTNLLSEEQFYSGKYEILSSKTRVDDVYTGGQFLRERLDSQEYRDHKLSCNWYLMFMDADNRLYVNGTQDDNETRYYIDKSSLTDDQYGVDMRQGSICYRYAWMVKVSSCRRWIWNKDIHEHVVPYGEWKDVKRGKLLGAYILSGRTGSRSKDPVKYLKDAVICERKIKEDPTDDHYFFYGAQSYRDAGKHEESIKMYFKRAEMKGWMEQVYISLVEAGKQQLNLYRDEYMNAIETFYKAFEVNSVRLEAPYYIVETYRQRNLFKTGWSFAKPLIDLDKPIDLLFVDEQIHGWMFFDSASICAYYSGDFEGGLKCAERALKFDRLPHEQVSRITTIVNSCRRELGNK